MDFEPEPGSELPGYSQFSLREKKKSGQDCPKSNGELQAAAVVVDLSAWN